MKKILSILSIFETNTTSISKIFWYCPTLHKINLEHYHNLIYIKKTSKILHSISKNKKQWKKYQINKYKSLITKTKFSHQNIITKNKKIKNYSGNNNYQWMIPNTKEYLLLNDQKFNFIWNNYKINDYSTFLQHSLNSLINWDDKFINNSIKTKELDIRKYYSTINHEDDIEEATYFNGWANNWYIETPEYSLRVPFNKMKAKALGDVARVYTNRFLQASEGTDEQFLEVSYQIDVMRARILLETEYTIDWKYNQNNWTYKVTQNKANHHQNLKYALEQLWWSAKDNKENPIRLDVIEKLTDKIESLLNKQ